jgi:glycerol-3-phosphate acyltransferase PlsY
MNHLLLLPAALLGYLIGSIPMGVLLARLFGWPDPREHGSGHTGGLNSLRGGGLAAGASVMLADIAKGAAAVLLAKAAFVHPYALTVAGVFAVVGHNWPVWLHFKGGMGLATGAGATGSQAPLAVVIALGLLAVFRLFIVRHTPRATTIVSVLLPLILWPLRSLLHLDLPTYLLAAVASLLIAARHTTDWNRVYEAE